MVPSLHFPAAATTFDIFDSPLLSYNDNHNHDHNSNKNNKIAVSLDPSSPISHMIPGVDQKDKATHHDNKNVKEAKKAKASKSGSKNQSISVPTAAASGPLVWSQQFGEEGRNIRKSKLKSSGYLFYFILLCYVLFCFVTCNIILHYTIK
jgi:hypothetical protein